MVHYYKTHYNSAKSQESHDSKRSYKTNATLGKLKIMSISKATKRYFDSENLHINITHTGFSKFQMLNKALNIKLERNPPVYIELNIEHRHFEFYINKLAIFGQVMSQK